MSVSDSCLIREAEPGFDDEAVAALMVDYLTWAIDRLASDYGVDEPPTHPSLVRDGLANYRPPVGRLILAECAGQPVGVGAIRTLRAGIVEVKRMYVAPGWRDQHVGSAILDRLLDHARGMGATTVLLDTCRFMTDAQRLYRSRGFVERSPYEGTEIPMRLQHLWIFFELRRLSPRLR
jgi:GNAT superfamily N-acetyltransferase